MKSPFDESTDKADWKNIRDDLIEDHPLDLIQVKDLVLGSFESLLKSRIGDADNGIKLFKDIEVSSQVTKEGGKRRWLHKVFERSI